MKLNIKRILKVLILIVTILLVILIAFIIKGTTSKYSTVKGGEINISTAKPICNMVINNNITISNYKPESLYFSVNNYDENNNISDVSMKYSLSFKINQPNNNLNYLLYELQDDGNEKLIPISNINGVIETKELNPLNAGVKQSIYYKLEVNYNTDSKINLDNDLKLSIILNSEQIKPEQRKEKAI